MTNNGAFLCAWLCWSTTRTAQLVHVPQAWLATSNQNLLSYYINIYHILFISNSTQYTGPEHTIFCSRNCCVCWLYKRRAGGWIVTQNFANSFWISFHLYPALILKTLWAPCLSFDFDYHFYTVSTSCASDACLVRHDLADGNRGRPSGG